MSVLRVLNVAEKPLSALRISRCLSENDFQTSRGSPAVHTFNYEEEGWRMTVISSNGHLQGINLGEDETRWEEEKYILLTFRVTTLNFGRCQTELLGQIVKLHLEGLNNMNLEFTDTYRGKSSTFSWSGSNEDGAKILEFYENSYEDATAIVLDVEALPDVFLPPPPLNTVELLVRASKFLQMSSQQTAAAAENLYIAGLICYPRTEADWFQKISVGDLRAILEHLVNHHLYGDDAQQLLGGNMYRLIEQDYCE
ncbi:DNA topoisomerase 3-alpha-like [Papaver somniferum]|uniref:DNA topoisomerase 3-alpha-like n=1 Tax=Papaver somniferum TaxID=3469 RepID=UPI000E70396D|nr:DNA topoisomerase 3-alpha-like [Papaver somniferum]